MIVVCREWGNAHWSIRSFVLVIILSLAYCLNDLSFPSLIQEHANSVLLSEATSANIYIYIYINF